MPNQLLAFFSLLPLLMFSGCHSSSYIPVEELSQAHRDAFSDLRGQTYIVVKGDTLFSIALRFDLDYRKLAYANNISPPYIIRPNDRIALEEKDIPVYRPATGPGKKPVVEPTTKRTGVVPQKRVKQTTGKLTNSNETQQGDQKPTAIQTQPATLTVYEKKWMWPVKGKILRKFSPQNDLNKGIDIDGSEGIPVKASRSGEVVYAGSGLKGYGNLIIIRHDDVYISAYAHNRSILVEEGQKIRQGDVVGELGMTGTDTPKLHFEIRKYGRPVDPLVLLPKK